MRIEIIVARTDVRVMHVQIARRLRAVGHAIRYECVENAEPAASGFDLLLSFEDMVYGPLKQDLLARAAIEPPDFDGAPDLVLACGGEVGASTVPVLSALFDGGRGLAFAAAAVLNGRAPDVCVVKTGVDGSIGVRERGQPAFPNPHWMKDCLNRVLGRAIDMIALAIRRLDLDSTCMGAAPPASSVNGQFVGSVCFGVASLAGKIRSRLQKLASGEANSHWRVAWRRSNDDAVSQTFAWPSSGYAVLADDGQRYYADPFIFARDGRTYLFVEEFPYATGKGIISVCEITTEGIASAPRPVMEIACHLSYPQVFERGGVVYMIPESVGVGELALYRAERFPDVWVRERVLIDNINLSDATLFERDGRQWLLGSVSSHGDSDWDTLCAFYADGLPGPWTALAANPVLFDAGQARSGGHVFERDGQLYRPTQDCTGGYGSALAICRIDRLDPDGFSQSVVARLGPAPDQGYIGVHTLNAAAGVEVIDVLGRDRSPQAGHSIFLNHARLGRI